MLDAEDLEQLAFAHRTVRSSNQLSAFSTAVAFCGNMGDFAMDTKTAIVSFSVNLAHCFCYVAFA